MPTNSTPKKPVVIYIKPYYVWLVTSVSLLLFVIFGVLWLQKVHTNPRRVFWGTMSSNLQTSGITRHSSNNRNGQSVDQYTQVSFVPPAASHNYVTLKQGEGDSKTEVKTETIGTQDTDYSRYVSIKANQKSSDGKALDFSKIQGQWGKSPDVKPGSPSSAQYFRQAALGLIPFANLDKKKRNELVKKIQDSNAYTVNFDKTKGDTINKKRVWIYEVKVNIYAYLGVVKAEGKRLGLGDLADLDSEQYKNSPPIEVKIAIDKYSRQVVQVINSDGTKEDYVSQGLSSPINIPNKTIPIDQLQEQLQAIR